MANYLERIQKDAKEKDVAAKKAQAEKAAINAQAAVYQAKTELNQAKSNLESAKNAEPFEIDAFLDATVAVEEAAKTFETLKAMQKELFDGLITD